MKNSTKLTKGDKKTTLSEQKKKDEILRKHNSKSKIFKFLYLYMVNLVNKMVENNI